MIATDYRSYRQLLALKLNERCETNPRYSLRAFARDLGLCPSSLCRVLGGKQGISEFKAKQIARSLCLVPEESEHFRDLVLASDARSRLKRNKARRKIAYRNSQTDCRFYSQRILQDEVFRLVSDWYHFAVLELSTLSVFRTDPSWIAKRLGISKREVQSAIERMKKLGLLKKRLKQRPSQPEETWVTADHYFSTTHEIPSQAVRKFNVQVLQKAIQALDMQSVSERHFETLTIAIDSAQLETFKEEIKAFVQKFNHKSETNKRDCPPNEVYLLGVQLFRLTTNGGINES